jgi:hypothetical protein
MENHTGEDYNVVHTAEGTVTRNVEVVVKDPSVCAGSVRNTESRIELRTAYPTNQEYFKISSSY